MHTSTSGRVEKIQRRRQIANETGGCDRCPPHKGENKSSRHARPDKYKIRFVPVKGWDRFGW